MKYHSSAASLALAVLALLGLAGSAAAGEQVPFTGTLEGSFTVTPVNPPLIVDILLTGSGNATHLGKFELVFPHRVDRSTVPATGVGIYAMRAANGDMVFAEVYGEATLVAPGLLHGVETATIIGGTGRFTDATGEFVMERLIDQFTLTTIGSFEGTISSPGND
jgi:hypothetical protein